MARQPRSREPKQKFAQKSNQLVCWRCGKPTASFDLITVRGHTVLVCKGMYGDCSKSTEK